MLGRWGRSESTLVAGYEWQVAEIGQNPFLGFYAVPELYRPSRIESGSNRRHCRCSSSWRSSGTQCVCSRPGSVLRDHCRETRLAFSPPVRMGTTLCCGYSRRGNIHCNNCAVQTVRSRYNAEEFLGRSTWRNSHLDTCLCTDYGSSSSRGPFEPNVRRRQLRLPLGLRGCNGSRLPLSHTPERQDENTGPHSLDAD